MMFTRMELRQNCPPDWGWNGDVLQARPGVKVSSRLGMKVPSRLGLGQKYSPGWS